VQLDFHDGTLRLRGVTAKFVERACANLPLVSDPRDDCYRCDAMEYSRVCRCLDRHLGQPWDNLVPQVTQVHLHPKASRNLRDDQRQAIAAFWNAAGRGIIVMPTGTGKTVVAIEIMLQAQTSTLVVVPVRDLMYQWHARILATWGVDAGLIGDGVHRVSPISVTTYESATIHMPRIGNRFQLVIFDEVHHLAGSWRSDAARMCAAPMRLGLTATLPADPQHVSTLEQLLGSIVYQQSITEAAGRSLAPYKIRRIAVAMDPAQQERYRRLGQVVQHFVRGRQEVDPRFRWDEIYKLTARTTSEPGVAAAATTALRAFRMKKRLEERAAGKFAVLEKLLREHAADRVLVFVGSNAMARDLSLRFFAPCLLSHCGKRERADLLDGFADGRYKVLIANQVLDEGVDLPEVKVAIVLGGMASSRQAVQRLGRILRRSASGQQAILYEIVTDKSGEVARSRARRRHDAFQKPARRDLPDADQ